MFSRKIWNFFITVDIYRKRYSTESLHTNAQRSPVAVQERFSAIIIFNLQIISKEKSARLEDFFMRLGKIFIQLCFRGNFEKKSIVVDMYRKRKSEKE